MTKLTKNEKIIRKASEKWKNFLAEGAFKKTVNESIDFRKVHFRAEMEPEELELLNIPEEEYKTKSKEEVEAIAAALDKAHDKSQAGVWLKYPKTATYDENEPIMRVINKKRKATRAITGEKGYVHYSDEESEEWLDSYSNDMPSDHHEQKEPSIDEARMGEYGKIDAEDGNPPTKIGRGNEEYMAAYNAVLQARGEKPLDIQKPDQAYLDALRSGQLQEAVDKRARQLLSEGLTPEQVKEKIIEEGIGDFLRKGADFVKAKTGLGMTTQSLKLLQQIKVHKDEYFAFRDKHYPDSSDVRNFIEFVEQNARKQAGGSGGMRRDDAYRAISREKFKTMDFPAGYTGKARKIISKVSKLYYDAATDGGAHKDKTLRKKVGPAVKALEADLEKAKDYLKQLRVAVKQAQKSGNSEGLRDVYKDQIAHERYLEKTQAIADAEFAAKAKEAERKRKRDRKKDDDMEFTGGQMSTKSRYAEEKKNIKEEVIEDFAIELEGGLSFADVEEAGLVTPGVDSVIDNGDGYAQVYAEPGAMAKMAKTLEAMTGVMVSPQSHGAVDEEMSKKDFVKMVRDKGKVPNLKGDMGPISGLEGPFQYRSGAVLYYDPKAGKYYDRGRDMYLDDQEAAELTMEDRTTMSSDPELDQIEDIARDMLEAGIQNSRIPVGLMSVASALKAQGFDATVSSGVLNIDGKYFMGKKGKFDISPDEDVRQVMGYVLGYKG